MKNSAPSSTVRSISVARPTLLPLAMAAIAAVAISASVVVQVNPGGEPSVVNAAAKTSFVETFDDPSSLDRFEYGIHHAWVANGTDETWSGDHGLGCGAPDPGRVVRNPTAIDGKTYYPGMRGESVYWCSPGQPDGSNGHLMTTFNSNHYAQVDFAPKDIFTDVNRVCWDQNRTDMGARQWTQVVIIPLDRFNANDGRMDYVTSRLKTNPGPGTSGIQLRGDDFLFSLSDGGTRTQVGLSSDTDQSGGNWTTTDKKQRYTICIEDQNNGKIRVELGDDSGGQVRTLDGAIPDGPSRVIFQDDTYNADKDVGVPNAYTWHWDNIIIDAGGSRTPSPNEPANEPSPNKPANNPSAAGEFDPVAPARLFESRPGEKTVDGRLRGGGIRGAGSVTEIDVVGRGGVPKGAGAVALNVTVTEAKQSGHMTVFSCDRSVPLASNLNYLTGETVANAVLSELSGDGKVCVYTTSAAHLVVDVNGSFPD